MLLYAAPLDALLRSIVIGQLGYYGDVDTVKEAQRRFAGYVSGRCTLPADLKEPIFSICLANGDSSTFDQLIKVGHHFLLLSLLLFFPA